MKNMISLFIAAMLLISASCNKDDGPGSISFAIHATFDGEPLVMFKNYVLPDGTAIQFSKSDFYISNLSLIKDDGTKYLLKDIELVDLTSTHSSEISSAQGFGLG